MPWLTLIPGSVGCAIFLGVVVFATAIAATPAHTHLPPKLRHHPTRYEVWNISTFVPAVIDVIRHCSGNPVSQVARANATKMCDHTVSVTLSRGSCSCSSRSGVISIRDQHCRYSASPECMQSSENCDETPRCSNICAADEGATHAGIQYHTTSAIQSSASAGSADLTAATNRAI